MENYIDSKLTSAALRYLSECFHFKKETGMSVGKANELLSTIIVNRWLTTNDYPWKIAISSKPTGVDGTIEGDMTGPRNVEFKSSIQRSPSFQFHPDFDFPSHGCIVMTQLLDGVPSRVFVAIGEESIKVIQSMAKEDMKRFNFGVKKEDMALVHMTARRKSPQRPDDVAGLVDRLGIAGSLKLIDRNDQIVMIENPQLAEFLKA